MRPNRVRELVGAGRTVVNAWMACDSSYAAEALSHSGFDSVTVDLQHGMLGRERAVALLQAISSGPAVPMARPATSNHTEVGWLLDAGAYGIIAPSIDTPDLARELVAACTYPPHGTRSFGAARGLLYGGADYVDRARDVITPWAMIESSTALAHLEEIAATPGLFGLYLGPNDLALDLGRRPGGPIDGPVAEAAHRIVDTARRAGRASGLFCSDGVEARRWADVGFDLVTPGNDLAILRHAAQARVDQVRHDDPAGEAPTAAGTGY